jgi:hypothetical protein
MEWKTDKHVLPSPGPFSLSSLTTGQVQLCKVPELLQGRECPRTGNSGWDFTISVILGIFTGAVILSDS